MNKFNKNLLFASFVLLPSVVFAQTNTNVNTLQQFTRPLSIGMKGNDVKQIQRLLASDPSIYPEAMITGYYGPLTEKAVKAFQKKLGLEEVGNIGQKTLSELNAVIVSAPKNLDTIPIVIKNATSTVVETTQVVNNFFNQTKPSVVNTINHPDVPFKAPKDLSSIATTTEHYIIRYKNTPTKLDEDNLRLGHKAQVRKRFNSIPAISADLDKSEYAKVLTNSNVLSVEVDKKIQVRDIEYDNTWGVTHLGASTTFSNGVTGQGVKVAVIDTGIDYNNSELSSQYAGGYNFVAGTADPMDDNGHGTHVAGTIAAAHNGINVVGVAPNVQLYALKVLDSTGSGYSSSMIAALDWAIANGVKIANHSYGSPTDLGQAAADAFARAEQAGVLSIASAGNAGTCAGDTDTVEYPAKYSSVLAVSATDTNNSRPCFSATGSKIELSAPGVNISSSKLGGGIVVYNGTSMSAPHVAGVAALVVDAGNKTNQPQTNTTIRQILNSSAIDLGVSGRDGFYGNGLVSAYKSVASVYSKVASTTPIATTTPPTSTTTNPIATTTPITQPIATTTPVIQPIATTTPTVKEPKLLPVKPIQKNPDTFKPSFPKKQEYEDDYNKKEQREEYSNQSWHRTVPVLPPQAQGRPSGSSNSGRR